MSSFYCDNITFNRVASYIYDHPTHPALKPLRQYAGPVAPAFLADALVLLNRKVMTDKYDHEGWPPFKFEHVDITEPEWVYATECWLYQTAEGDVPTSNKLWLAIKSAVINIKESSRFDTAAYVELTEGLTNSNFWV